MAPVSPPSGAKPKNWRKSSSTSLPPLTPALAQRLEQQGQVEFPINEECTSLALVPSGRHVVAGFTDGTLRLFDLTGHFSCHAAPLISGSSTSKTMASGDDYDLFDSDSSDDDDDDDDERIAVKASSPSVISTTTMSTMSTGSTTALVCSKSNQRYGAVACQIHAKGVHTSLQMTVAVSPDGLYAFGGVARGSMELVAVHLAKLEEHHERVKSGKAMPGLDMLDLMDVNRHADAKLRGFGACTRLMTSSSTYSAKSVYEDDPTYILLTGKGIKNIHIWSFRPLTDEWQCLYDTQSNGNSISLLHIRYSATNKLQAISKSDNQKLRVWDLSHEQDRVPPYDAFKGKKKKQKMRPKRPPYKDIAGTEATMGIGGDFGFGGSIDQQISLTNLEVDAPYNLTELALPSASGAASNTGSGTRGGRRQQRGELRSLSQVAGMSMDASHVLMEMSDQSVVHFYFAKKSLPRLETVPIAANNMTDGSRTLSLARVGSEGITVAAMASTYNSKGSILIRQIGDASSEGFWGFRGAVAPTEQESQNELSNSSPEEAGSKVIAKKSSSAVKLFTKKKKKRSRSDSIFCDTPSADAVSKPSIIPVASPASYSSTKSPLAKRHTIFPDSNSPTVPASALEIFAGVASIEGRPLPVPTTKNLAMDGAAVSPESHATPRHHTPMEVPARQLHAAATIQPKRKKKKRTLSPAIDGDQDKENGKLQGSKKLILHIRRPKEPDPSILRDTTITEKSSNSTISEIKMPVIVDPSPLVKQQQPNDIRQNMSEVSMKIMVTESKEIAVLAVPTNEIKQYKAAANQPSVGGLPPKSISGEDHRKAAPVTSKENKLQLKPTDPRRKAVDTLSKSMNENKTVETSVVSMQTNPTELRAGTTHPLKQTPKKRPSDAVVGEKKQLQATPRSDIHTISAKSTNENAQLLPVVVSMKDQPRSTTLQLVVTENPTKSTNERKKASSSVVEAKRTQGQSTPPKHRLGVTGTSASSTDERKKTSSPVAKTKITQQQSTPPTYRLGVTDTSVLSTNERKKTPPPAVKTKISKLQSTPPTHRSGVTDTSVLSTNERKKTSSPVVKIKKTQQQSSPPTHRSGVTENLVSPTNEKETSQPQSKATTINPTISKSSLTSNNEKKKEAQAIATTEKQQQITPTASVSESSLKSIKEKKKKALPVATTKEKNQSQQAKPTATRTGVNETSTKQAKEKKKRAPHAAAAKEKQPKPTSLRPSVSDTSLKSVTGEKKRKGILARRTSPAVFAVPPPPKKRSRTVEANLGNTKMVNLAPLTNWRLPSVAQRFESFPRTSISNTEDRRIKLALEHRAIHETIRRKVLDAVTPLMQSMNQVDPPSAEDLKNRLEDDLARYSELLDDHVFRQELEASALAAALALPFTPAVSFPFPEVFDQARRTMTVFLDQRKKEIHQ